MELSTETIDAHSQEQILTEDGKTQQNSFIQKSLKARNFVKTSLKRGRLSSTVIFMGIQGTKMCLSMEITIQRILSLPDFSPSSCQRSAIAFLTMLVVTTSTGLRKLQRESLCGVNLRSLQFIPWRLRFAGLI